MLNLLSFADVELTFGEAALYSVIGFVLIIVVLAVMALLIALLNYCRGRAGNSAQRAEIRFHKRKKGEQGLK